MGKIRLFICRFYFLLALFSYISNTFAWHFLNFDLSFIESNMLTLLIKTNSGHFHFFLQKHDFILQFLDMTQTFLL